MEQTLARLGNRVFLLHNVHEEGASIFESRWAMSYLRGPMTRSQIKALMDARRAPAGGGPSRRTSAAPAGARIGVAARAGSPATAEGRRGCEWGANRNSAFAPRVATGNSAILVPARDGGEEMVYEPMLLGAASVASLIRKRRLI